jgi:Transglutaminase-like superfamily
VNSLYKLQRLSWPERWLLIQALLLLPLTALALRLLGFKRWQSVLTSRAPINDALAAGQEETAVQQAHITAKIVKAATRHGPYRANCLQQSLVLWWLLRRQEITSELRIGVRKEGSRLEAHAWVEFLGAVLNESNDVRQHFEPFDRAVLAVGVKSQ